jgi:transposase
LFPQLFHASDDLGLTGPCAVRLAPLATACLCAHPQSRATQLGDDHRPLVSGECPAQESHPEVARLEQVKGVGTLIALTCVLTLEDPRRFRKSRDVGCYLGLRPGRRNSGQSEPQLHSSKEGDPYLRTLLVQGAHPILGPFGADSDLRRWGLKLAERGGKNAKKRAVVAVARKLSILLHRLWVSGEVYEPLRKQHVLTAAA